MDKHYNKAAAFSSTQPSITAKQVRSELIDDKLQQSAEPKVKYSDPISMGYSTINNANQQQVNRFTRTHQLYCFFTRKKM